MAVTSPTHRDSLLWSRLHFLMRFLGLTGSQWSSIVVVVACVATLIRFRMRPLAPGTETEPAVPTDAVPDSG